MRKREILWIVIALIVVVPLVSAYVMEVMAVNECKASGGSFNYVAMQCDSAAKHEYIPFGRRHLGLFTLTVMILFSLAIAKWVTYRRRLGT
jgi:hypothetical protein